MSSLVRDLSDGVRLIQLMVSETVAVGIIDFAQRIIQEIMGASTNFYVPHRVRLMLPLSLGDVSLGRYNKTPRMRVQKAENVNKALEFITSRGVKLTNIGPEGAFYQP
jgi:cofilin